MRIILDTLGADNGAAEAVLGASMAAERDNIEILLVGHKDELERIMKEKSISDKRLSILDATETVEMEDDPANVIRTKKDSSMVKALNALKQDEGDGLVSAGNTGALLTGATAIVGRIRGVRRGALAPIIPNRFGGTLLIDCGANVECTPEYLLQFAVMGSAYMERTREIKNPKVALLNNGTEETKGTQLYRDAYVLLKEAHEAGSINFVGNIEGREVFSGKADVLVCDGFVGNMVLKTIEGTAKFFAGEIKSMFTKSIVTKIASLAVKSGIRDMRSMLDYRETGGSPIIGIRKPVFKAHGSSDAKAFSSAIHQVVRFVEGGAIDSITSKFNNKKDE